jgi:hypothetical protein
MAFPRMQSGYSFLSQNNQVVELNASGRQVNSFIKQDKTDIEVLSSYSAGVYRLLLKRSLSTGDEDDVRFTVNRHIPFSIVAYDGKNNEEGSRGALSGVRYLILK